MKKIPVEIPVNEFSSPITDTATEEMHIQDVFKLMKDKGYRHLPVQKDNMPVGIISERDIRFLQSVDLGKSFIKAKDIMSPTPYCVNPNTPLEEVAFEMSQRKIGSALLVNPNGELDGIFTSTDGLNALIEVVRGDY